MDSSEAAAPSLATVGWTGPAFPATGAGIWCWTRITDGGDSQALRNAPAGSSCRPPAAGPPGAAIDSSSSETTSSLAPQLAAAMHAANRAPSGPAPCTITPTGLAGGAPRGRRARLGRRAQDRRDRLADPRRVARGPHEGPMGGLRGIPHPVGAVLGNAGDVKQGVA